MKLKPQFSFTRKLTTKINNYFLVKKSLDNFPTQAFPFHSRPHILLSPPPTFRGRSKIKDQTQPHLFLCSTTKLYTLILSPPPPPPPPHPFSSSATPHLNT